MPLLIGALGHGGSGPTLIFVIKRRRRQIGRQVKDQTGALRLAVGIGGCLQRETPAVEAEHNDGSQEHPREGRRRRLKARNRRPGWGGRKSQTAGGAEAGARAVAVKTAMAQQRVHRSSPTL